MRLRRALALPALLAVLVGGCSDSAVEQPTPAAPTATEEPTTATTADSTSGPTTEPTQPTGTAAPTGELPGEVVEIHPYAGDELGVVGVAADDVLHVRSGPGVEFDSITELEPLTAGVVASGHNRYRDDGSFWAQVEAAGVSGWASTFYLAHLGAATDITAALDTLPTAQTVEQAAIAVAEQRMDTQLPSTHSLIVDGPHAGDLHEVTIDLLGFADDSVLGERLHVFATSGSSGFTVRTVEATVLCARGVSEGLCI